MKKQVRSNEHDVPHFPTNGQQQSVIQNLPNSQQQVLIKNQPQTHYPAQCPPQYVPQYLTQIPYHMQSQGQFQPAQPTDDATTKKPRKPRAKKGDEIMIEVVPIEIKCPNKKHANYHLHEVVDKIELSKIIGWNSTVTKDNLVKGFQIECIINDSITDAIIDRSVIYSIAKTEVQIMNFHLNRIFLKLIFYVFCRI